MFICELDHLNIVFEVKVWAASIRKGFIQDFCFLFFVFFFGVGGCMGGCHRYSSLPTCSFKKPYALSTLIPVIIDNEILLLKVYKNMLRFLAMTLYTVYICTYNVSLFHSTFFAPQYVLH